MQVQLLDLLSLVLARRPHRDSLSQAQLHALSQALLLGAPLASTGIPRTRSRHARLQAADKLQ